MNALPGGWRSRLPRMVVCAAWVAVGFGCSESRPWDRRLQCPDYEREVQPVLDRRCGRCHGPLTAKGDFRLDSRTDALARRDDGSLRVTGAAPAALAAVRGALEGHAVLEHPEELALLERWLGECRAGPGNLAWHTRGWSTPGEDDFHGLALRRDGYHVEACAECHGADLAGGKASVSCVSCHAAGVFACDTCHGTASSSAPPRSLGGARATSVVGVGAHWTHVNDGPLHRAYDCTECHPKVVDALDDGHFRVGGEPDDGVAEVVMTRPAGSPPRWHRPTATCTNTRCHAPYADPAATNLRPTWTRVGVGEAACGTCHGAPPASHGPETDCTLCHGTAYLAGAPSPDRHADGVVQVGRPGRPDGCAGCHGDGTTPFYDTLDRTDPALQSVGAHDAHLAAARGLMRPLRCEDCHLVPEVGTAPGHLDTVRPAEVFPAVEGVAALARSDSAIPFYDPGTGSCAGGYCHGGGGRAARDTSASKRPFVRWTGGAGEVSCGTCHGLPPNTSIHTGFSQLTDCAACHGATVDAQGAVKAVREADGGVTTTHLDGVVQLGP